MNSMGVSMKDRWIVVNEIFYNQHGNLDKLRRYLFGQNLLEFYDEDELPDIEVVPYEEWTAKDFAVILSNEYENANYHRMTNVPDIILNIIKERKYDNTEEDVVMRKICEALYDNI